MNQAKSEGQQQQDGIKFSKYALHWNNYLIDQLLIGDI
jgi:hypothetical protein